jgi:class 3 adenylate cyclase
MANTSMAKGLPSGTVTFLFTDIEGSTRILRDLGERYSDLLALHHRLLRDVWVATSRCRGVDRRRRVLRRVRQCGRCAGGGGRRTACTGRVRSGRRSSRSRCGWACTPAHARPVDDDYRALAVHQAARVVDAANGGQILATAEAIALRGDVEIEVTDLGHYRVRDFDEPIVLYRVSASDLGGDDRPPRVRPADSHNLVRPTTSMVNRVIEQADLADMLRAGSVVTLLGPGGAGKTRLSIEVGLNVVERWPDGVWFVDMAPLSEEEVVPMAIALAVNARSALGNDSRADVVATSLIDRCCWCSTTASISSRPSAGSSTSCSSTVLGSACSPRAAARSV